VAFLGITFAKKKIPPAPKNGLERRIWQFYTIYDKNQLLNKNIKNDMTILIPRWLDFGCQVLSRTMCPNVTVVDSVFVWAAFRKPPVSKLLSALGKMAARHTNLK
jgi:hypothetical protein